MLHTLALLALLASPQTPDATLPPAAAHVRYTLIGHGVQIYQCTASSDAADAAFQWTLQGPEALLYDPVAKQQVGTHTAGPTWTWNDGSAITGKVLQKQPSADPAAIPWLLLEAHTSGDKTGALTGIVFVRRSDTQAGAAPATGCDAQHRDNVLRVPYQATYTFYTAN
jgi:hypothetical protein